MIDIEEINGTTFTMNGILDQMGLGNLTQRFADERVDLAVVPSLTNGEVTRLGVTTSGDRARDRGTVMKCARVCWTAAIQTT